MKAHPFVMHKVFAPLNQAIDALRLRKMIILADNEHRENEGDLVIAAQYVTAADVNFMLKVARGLICLPMLSEDLNRIGIPAMVPHNTALFSCAFMASVDAADAITTGSSAHDRAYTIQLLTRPSASLKDFAIPGHVFPLRCHEQRLLGRQGHTEGSIALMEMAQLKPMSLICEILKEDGSMARLQDLVQLADQYQLPLVSMTQILEAKGITPHD